jgi:SnoaL-like domain
MSFDPVAAAIDWLDAYRSSDLEQLLKMFADNAVIECGCCAMTTLTGKKAARAYWRQRFWDCVPFDLITDIQPTGEGATISYRARDGVVAAVLEFNSKGKIAFLRMGPPK